ncbi:MAG: hypothetical protein GX591_00895 [Planctomycetes bacterium]|nr:hypothetical protein [Planctomycetota bacterium]
MNSRLSCAALAGLLIVLVFSPLAPGAIVPLSEGEGLTFRIDEGGQAAILNLTDAPISFDGYEIRSAGSLLDVTGWTSLFYQRMTGTDLAGLLGPGVEAFIEMKRSTNYMVEASLTSLATLQPGASVSLGLMAPNATYDDLRIKYVNSYASTSILMTLDIVGLARPTPPPPPAPIPEPVEAPQPVAPAPVETPAPIAVLPPDEPVPSVPEPVIVPEPVAPAPVETPAPIAVLPPDGPVPSVPEPVIVPEPVAPAPIETPAPIAVLPPDGPEAPAPEPIEIERPQEPSIILEWPIRPVVRPTIILDGPWFLSPAVLPYDLIVRMEEHDTVWPPDGLLFAAVVRDTPVCHCALAIEQPPIPEPGSAALLLAGVGLLRIGRRRVRRRAAAP